MDPQNNKPLSLKFHSFYCRLYLPFIIFTGCLSLFSYFYQVTVWDSFSSAEKVWVFFFFAYDICTIYLSWMVATDLSKLNYDGFKLNKVLLCVFCFNSLLRVLFTETLGIAISTTCGISFIALLINYYYNKREHLFIHDEAENDTSTDVAISQATDNSPSESSDEQTDKVKIIIKRKPTK